MWLLEDDVQEEIQKKSKHNDIAGVKAVGRRKRCNYSINYLISIHLKDPLTWTNHFKKAAKCSILTHLLWQEEECGACEGGWRNAKICREIKERNWDPQKEGSSSTWTTSRIKTHGVWFLFFLRKVHLFLPLKSTFNWQRTEAKWRRIETAFWDIPEYKKPWLDIEFTPSILLFFRNKGSS